MKTEQEVLECAVRLLARREHFESEMIRKLRQRGYERSVCLQTIERLINADLLSNDRACEQYVREKVARGYGPLKILANLRQREVPCVLIQRYLERGFSDWCVLLATLCERRFGSIMSSITLKERRFLLGRGFTGEMIHKVLSKSYHNE